MRVRGLKLNTAKAAHETKKSHPMRVRGLKLKLSRTRTIWKVAPHAGAWIETTIATSKRFSTMTSHPMRVRGLKHRYD